MRRPIDQRQAVKWAVAVAALAALAAAAGCTAWHISDSKQLARESAPFQSRPANEQASLLIIGDSTAVGTGASSPAASVAGLIGAEHKNLRIDNRAVDGAKYADFVQQLQHVEGNYDAVLVLGGGNDVIRFTSEDNLRASIFNAADLARQHSRTVILMPPGNVGNAPFFFAPASWWMDKRSRTLHELVRQAAQRTDATYVDLYKKRSEDPFALHPREMHARDGLHPSDAGYRLWFSELQQQGRIEQALSHQPV